MKNELRENIAKFIFGGDAMFTILSDNHAATYHIRMKKTKDGSKVFQCCVRRSNQETYFGYLKVVENVLTFRHNGKFGVPENSPDVSLLLSVIHQRNNLPEHTHFLHSGRCARCGRPLTDVKSIELGFGPDCCKKAGVSL